MTFPLHKQSVHPFDQEAFLGIGLITVVPGQPQKHVGIIYRTENNNPPHLCHLEWHLTLSDEPLHGDYYWAQSTLDATSQLYLAAFVATLKQNAKDVPYGFDYGGMYFDDAGRYVPGESGRGLTCATFVMAVFASKGFDLLQVSDWPHRDQDTSWQQQIIDHLSRSKNATPEHIAAMRQDVGQAKRFRPEEVAAGVMSEEIPINFESASSLALKIVEEMTRQT